MKKLCKLVNAYKLFKDSSYFDEQYYSAKYHVPKSLCIIYDLLFGCKKENNPSIFFDTRQYYVDYPDVKAAGMNALYHYLMFGRNEYRVGRCSHSFAGTPYSYMYDPMFYAKTYMTEEERHTQIPMEHYLQIGWKKKYLPFEKFDLERFYAENPECDKEPLQYWYDEKIPVAYLKEKIYGEEGFMPFESQALQYLYRNQQIDWLKKNKANGNLKKLILVGAPGKSDAPCDMFRFQNIFKEMEKQADEKTKVIAVSMPTNTLYFGEDLYPENIRVINYFFVSRCFNAEEVDIVLFPTQVEGFTNYIDAAYDEVLEHCAKVKILLVNRSCDPNIYARLENRFTYIEEICYHHMTEAEISYYDFFDPVWYKKTYEKDIDVRKMDAKSHYIKIGWRERKKPFEYFDIDRFYEENPECDIEPLYYWYVNRIPKMYFTKRAIPMTDLRTRAGGAMQKLYRNIQNGLIEQILPYDNDFKKVLMIIVSPEDAISGGIMSFCGIHRLSLELEKVHGRKVIAVSLPGDATHSGFTMFKNNMPVFRYEQIQNRLRNTEDIMIMLPELYCVPYLSYIKEHAEDAIHFISKCHLNILNQRVELMPDPSIIEQLKCEFDVVTQTAAHYSYATQEQCDYYGIATHLLIPPIFKEFNPLPYEKKEEIFAYSYDEHPWKQRILDAVQKGFPNMKLVEIWNISFDEYMDLIAKAKWCMTFGEGLDGYFSEPYEAGSISFAVWNDVYFTDIYKNLQVIFPDSESAALHIVDKMKKLDNKKAYEKANAEVRRVHDIEYAGKRTPKDQLRDFFEGRYDHPHPGAGLVGKH